MTRLFRLRRFSLAGVCAAAIGVGGVQFPATAFADWPDCGSQTMESCSGGGFGGAPIFGGPGSGAFGGGVIPGSPGYDAPAKPGIDGIPPSSGPIREPFRPPEAELPPADLPPTEPPPAEPPIIPLPEGPLPCLVCDSLGP